MKVTFAIPYYRDLHYLQMAVSSVFRQTTPSWELLIVDDCSPDTATDLGKETANWIRTQMNQLGLTQSFKYFRNETNLGLQGCWNRCLNECQTEAVTLLHSDDELEPQYAEKVINTLTQHPKASAVFVNAQVIDESGSPTFSFPDYIKKWLRPKGDPLMLSGEHGLKSLARGNYIFCPSVCYRTRSLGDQRFSPRWKMVLDFEFNTRLLLQGALFVGLGGPALYRYRRHTQNMTVHLNRNLVRFEEERSFWSELALLADKNHWPQAARQARFPWIQMLGLVFETLRDLKALQLNAALKKCKFLRSWIAQIAAGVSRQ